MTTTPVDGPRTLTLMQHVRRTIGNPRFLLAVLAVLMAIVTMQTFRYPPDYLAHPTWWALVVAVGACTCACAAWRPQRLTISASGTAVIGASVLRGIANAMSITDQLRAQDRASLTVAACLWFTIAILTYHTWVAFLLPWAARTRSET